MKILIAASACVLALTSCASKPSAEVRTPASDKQSERQAELKREADVISSAPKKSVIREKEQLTLNFKNKKKKVFKDSIQEGTENYLRSVLVEYVAKQDVAVVQQFFYEGGRFLVISMKDGSEVITSTKPTWSEDKSNFISVNDDESDYTENVVVIGSCKAKKCSKAFSEKTHSGAEKWIDNKTVEFEKRKFDAGTGASEVTDMVCKIDKKVTCSEKQTGP